MHAQCEICPASADLDLKGILSNKLNRATLYNGIISACKLVLCMRPNKSDISLPALVLSSKEHATCGRVTRAQTPLQAELCCVLQARYALGDATHSFVSGYGKDPPSHVQNQAASCPNPPATCTAVNGLLNPDPNPRLLYGALVEGWNGDADTWSDTRSLNMTRAVVEYNAGWQGLLAGLNELSMGVWEQCLQGQGIITKDRSVCT